MLRFEMIENKQGLITYAYYPDGKAEFGIITVRKNDNEIVNQKIAPNDDFKWCFLKMLKKIREFISKNEFEKDGVIAWY